jgi:hypothetical protein
MLFASATFAAVRGARSSERRASATSASRA